MAKKNTTQTKSIIQKSNISSDARIEEVKINASRQIQDSQNSARDIQCSRIPITDKVTPPKSNKKILTKTGGDDSSK